MRFTGRNWCSCDFAFFDVRIRAFGVPQTRLGGLLVFVSSFGSSNFVLHSRHSRLRISNFEFSFPPVISRAGN